MPGPWMLPRSSLRSTLCPLAAALQQFMDACCRQGHEVLTHAATLGSCVLAICAGPSFSVVAVVAKPKVGAHQ